MKKVSKIVKLKNKIKWLKVLKYYPVICLGLLIAFIGLDIFCCVKGLWGLGGVFTGLAITSGIVTLASGAMGVDKLIDSKIERIEKEIEEIKNENAFENQIYYTYQNSTGKEQTKLIRRLINEKNKTSKRIKELNPNLDVEYMGNSQDFTL